MWFWVPGFCYVVSWGMWVVVRVLLQGFCYAVAKELWVFGRVLLLHSVTKGNLPSMLLRGC